MIAVSLTRDCGTSPSLYRFAGEDFLLAGDWLLLSSFVREVGSQRSSSMPAPRSPFRELRYYGPATLAGQAPLLTCLQGDDGYLLRSSPGASLWVSADGSVIAQRETADDAIVSVSSELLFGPAMLLALALHGIFALHASAVRWGDRVVAFVGHSGAGKSTLASLLHEPTAGFERVADDILPFALADGIPVARPSFPQLKLTTDQQWGPSRPESLPLAAVYRLATPSAAGSPRVVCLRGGDALAALAAHSVASALFGPDLLRRHLEALATTVEGVRVADLHYPRSPDVGPQVRQLIGRNLGV